MQLIQRAIQHIQPALKHIGLGIPPKRSIRPDDLFELGSFYIGKTSFVVADIDDDAAKPNLRVFERRVGTKERHVFYAVVDLTDRKVLLDPLSVNALAHEWVVKLQASLWPVGARLN